MLSKFNSTIELLKWRREGILNLADGISDSNRMKQEYLIRVKEINWLISKFESMETEIFLETQNTTKHKYTGAPGEPSV